MAKDRQKKIVTVVLATVALGWLTYQTGMNLFYRPWHQLFEKERDLERRAEAARTTKVRLAQYAKEWAGLGERTFASTPLQVSAQLPKTLGPLLARIGLANIDPDPVVTMLAPVKNARGSTSAPVSAAVRGKGSLSTVFKAISQLDNYPRLGWLREVTIRPQDSASAKPGSKRDWELLGTYESEWLGQPAVSGRTMSYAVAEDDKLPAAKRKNTLDLAACDNLAELTMFERWQRKVVVVAPPPQLPPRQADPPRQTDRQPPQPPPPVRPAYEKWAITTIEWLEMPDGEMRAARIDDKTPQGRIVQEGDRLADGVVTRIDCDYFYIVLKLESGQDVVIEAGRTLAERIPAEGYRPPGSWLREEVAGPP